jgi:hypothetical protein
VPNLSIGSAGFCLRSEHNDHDDGAASGRVLQKSYAFWEILYQYALQGHCWINDSACNLQFYKGMTTADFWKSIWVGLYLRNISITY